MKAVLPSIPRSTALQLLRLPTSLPTINTRLGLGFRWRRLCCCNSGDLGGERAMESSMSVVVKERINLSEKEEIIFSKLLSVVRHFSLDTQLRVAGGWVRDKLLHKECYDIDIALDNMLGREFCDKVNEYLQYAGEEHQGTCVIPCNPDQSKHLETARMRINGTWIDFVNLRSETYAENSRIPAMMFGTAKEDAFRRDLTINSLFYNINKDVVEDFTGRGISDLKAGYIVTPLPPKQTFLDDPLRVLRAIRFGARFDFVLDEELKKAASDEEVKVALSDKISRERIGHEIDLMMSDKRPVKALTYICDLELFFVVFALPANPKPEPTEVCARLCVSYMDAAWNLLTSVGYSSLSDEQRRLYLYGALFIPFRNTIYFDKKSKQVPVTSFIVKESLKLKASDAEMVVSLHTASERFTTLIPIFDSKDYLVSNDADIYDEFLEIPPASNKRVLAGLLLRQIKDYWRVSLLISILLWQRNNPTDIADNNEKRDLFFRVRNSITELELENVWKVKPLLDGNAIMDVLQLKKGGPLVKEWHDRVVKWQLVHPQGTVEECLEWMKQSQSKRQKLD